MSVALPGRARTILALGALVMAISVGIRAALGVFVTPLSALHSWPLATFSIALACQNLLWGLIQPLVGAAADMWGAGRVVAAGALIFALGLWLSGVASDPWIVGLGSGVALGIAMAAASFPIVLASVGRAVGPARRSFAMGVAIAGGSAGQVVLPPLAAAIVTDFGVSAGLDALAVIALLMILPAMGLGERKKVETPEPDQPSNPWAAVASAWRSADYRLVVIGFFACGFQLAFISIHLPGHVSVCGMGLQTGATALAVMGAFNVIGCWGSGVLGGRWCLPRLLAGLYAVRALAIAFLLVQPLSRTSLFAFAAVTGLTWLATVPLTSALIARMFGPRYLGTLFGVAFLSHQLGSFAGALGGGWAFDSTGSYGSVWVAAAILGLLAAWLHWAIDEGASPQPE